MHKRTKPKSRTSRPDRISHLLVCLMEEAAEVQKECAKALRFGLDDEYKGTTPESRLMTELNDLNGVWRMLWDEGVKLDRDEELIESKVKRLTKAMRCSAKTGRIKP